MESPEGLTVSLDHERLLTFKQLAEKMTPAAHHSTLWRWAKYGIDGVRLEFVRRGCRYFSSLEAVRRFEAALAAKMATVSRTG